MSAAGECDLRDLVVATTNPGKARELRRLLAGVPARLVRLDELGIVPPAETGATFAANATLKARHAAEASGLPALADDSGLVVDALGGAPGVFSARYAGAGATDEENRRRLVAELTGTPPDARAARFVCALAIAAPDGEVTVVEGTLEGVVLTEPRGEGGFGYDPLFLLPEHGKTLAELSLDEKNAISHRARAAAAAAPVLRRLLGTCDEGAADAG